MDCREFMLEMWAILDEEMDVSARETFHAHLAMCPPCQRHFQFESILRIHVRQCCQEPAPELVRRRIQRFVAGLGDA